MFDQLNWTIKSKFNFIPNRNQQKDIERLIFEIIKREEISLEEIIKYLEKEAPLSKYSGRNRFFALKQALLKRRFPLSSEALLIDSKKVFLPAIKKPLLNNWRVDREFKPLKIFIEKRVKKSWILDNFKTKFPEVEVEEINYYGEYIRKNRFNLSSLKKPLVFITKEKWDFIKPCPCTKHHLNCGYWIFNLGMGCPFDCSYCFLQAYTNSVGIILPQNIDDFLEKFNRWEKKLKKIVRIGTGEFCDSLALDDITLYSKKLLPFFKNKKVLFELKTKSDNINNLLDIEPASNIIISFSLNPEWLVEKEELGTSSLENRLKAAQKLQKRGYRLGFHFDPIIYYSGWESDYFNTIRKVYSVLKGPFAWISMGTLRGAKKLKIASELRFPQSKIFYGELFIGEDKKLRYPLFLRKIIYKKMFTWIRKFDSQTPCYLCMEDNQMWEAILDRQWKKVMSPN